MDNYMDLQKKHISYATQGKVTLCTGIALFIALLIITCFHNYARFLFRNRRRVQQLLSIPTAGTAPNTISPKGLDPSVIKTIPTVIYSTKAANHFPPLECSVCLSEFENDEKARVLPECNHTFHVDCIDMWFYSHSNCPLCRAPVQADHIPVNSPKIVEQTIVPVAEPEPAGSEPPREDIEMNISSATASSSSSSSPLKMETCPMKTLELVGVGIMVEVPTGEESLTGGVSDMGSGSDPDPGPGHRILSLKRIWI
ncbi:hypothetical protein REPUB_Repub12eG0151500 [Reevesia pubescens]